MKRSILQMIWRGLQAAAHSGFPWAAGGREGHSLALRRALRRSVAAQFPRAVRPAALALSTLLWPVQSLLDALTAAFQADPSALGGRSRLLVALRAWGAALGCNLPPVDFLSYRLFEPGRPGAGFWLHSGDSQLHFSRIAAPAVRSLAWDKLAFADFATAAGADAMPVLAVYGAEGAVRPFAEGVPPPRDLLVKPRRGFGATGHTVWRWQEGRHIGPGGHALQSWLAPQARQGDLLVQDLAQPPEHFGSAVPVTPPVISILTAEWPDGRRCPAFAIVSVTLPDHGGDLLCVRQIDLASGDVMAPPPGSIAPVFRHPPDRRDLGAMAIPGWAGLLSQIDRVHGALPGPAPVLKWDIMLTDLGPRLLEINTGTGIYVIQSMTLRPITETPVGPALEAWAR